ncbi:MAG TPA: DapH/DapD/GlmU-related protein [Armatimonadota bacterium]
MGKRVYIGQDVIIDSHHCWLISIGDDCKFAPRVHILAHDGLTKTCTGYTRVGHVIIGDRTVVGSGAIILPGVTIGKDVLIGAGSVVNRDIPDGVLVSGNPAKVICTTKAYAAMHTELMKQRPVYPARGFTLQGGITREAKQQMIRELQDDVGYIE